MYVSGRKEAVAPRHSLTFILVMVVVMVMVGGVKIRWIEKKKQKKTADHLQPMSRSRWRPQLK